MIGIVNEDVGTSQWEIGTNDRDVGIGTGTLGYPEWDLETTMRFRESPNGNGNYQNGKMGFPQRGNTIRGTTHAL